MARPTLRPALDAPSEERPDAQVHHVLLLHGSYTGEAAKAMIERPSDRSAAAKALTESLGGTLEAFYWMHGHHDGFLITKLPDGVAAAALAGAVGATGAVGGLETHQIFDHDEQAAIVKSAATARGVYKPPTA